MARPFTGPTVVRHTAVPTHLQLCALPAHPCAFHPRVLSPANVSVSQVAQQWQPQHPEQQQQQQQQQQPCSVVHSASVLSYPAQAVQPAHAAPKSFAGGLFAVGTSGDVATKLALQRIHVDVLVVDRVAVHKLAQTFRNDESSAVQVTYVFPLPDGSSVLGFSAHFGSGRELHGVLKECREAHSDYISALRQGTAALLLDEQRADVFQTSIGNLQAGEDVTVQLRYCLELPVDGHDCIRLTIPAYVDPRYTPKARAGSLQLWQQAKQQQLQPRPLQQPLQQPAELTGFRRLQASRPLVSAFIECEIRNGVQSVESPTHPAATCLVPHRNEGGRVTIELAEHGLDKDFVLLVKPNILSEPTLRGRSGMAGVRMR